MAKSFGELYAKAELTAGYHAERMAIGFLAELQAQMKARGMSNSDLARAAEVSPAYISKLFRGPSNVSLETVAKLAMAVDCRPHLHLADHKARVRWFDVIHGRGQPPARAPGASRFHEMIRRTWNAASESGERRTRGSA